MRNLLYLLVSLAYIVLLSGCPNNKPKYYKGFFPLHPVNFFEVNSEYDDYNSALPIINYGQYLYFSSNRNSSGQDFDIVGDNLNIVWDIETGHLTIDNSQTNSYTGTSDSLFNKINTSANEFGPTAVNYWPHDYSGTEVKIDMITYSSNFEDTSYKSKFVYYGSDMTGNGSIHGPYAIHMINSMSNAQYISFLLENPDNNVYWDLNPCEYKQIIFNANVEGNTDIFSIDLPENNDFVEMLKTDTIISPVNITSLNSVSEDKCPFVNAHLMVFSSNREGGFGGYDLYYSWYENGIWSDPVNLGEEINTEHDEFRPVTVYVHNFENDLMIFSSNRPGGKGGFDLYYVGLPFKVLDLVLLEEKAGR